MTGKPRPALSPPTALARAGLAALGFVVVLIAVAALGRFVLDPALPGWAAQLIRAALVGALVTGGIIFLCRREGRALSGIGLTPLRGAWRPFLLGAGFWLALAAVGLLAGLGTGAFRLVLTAPDPALLGVLALQIVIVFLYEALPEEAAFRGYALSNLMDALGAWAGVAIQALLFMLAGFAIVALMGLLGFEPGWAITLDRAILLLTFGATLALFRLWTGSLWAAIGFHLAFQTVMQLFFAGRLIGLQPASPADAETASVFLWFFAIVIGGVIALTGLFVDKRRRDAGWRKPPRISPGRGGQAT
jgi:uncharacterized protein